MPALTPLRIFWVLLRHEFVKGFKEPLFFIALLCLLILPFPVRMAYGGDFMLMGRTVGESYRLMVAMIGGYSLVAFLSSVYALCLCMDRFGSGFLRNNDLLILSRPVGRLPFLAAKITALFLNAYFYCCLGFFWLWSELLVMGVSGVYKLLFLLFPLALNLACLIAIYFALRSFLSNFLVFFLWLIALPMLFFTGLWHCYADSLNSTLGIFLWLPQIGGLHAWALGIVHPLLQREIATKAILNMVLWLLGSLTLGIFVFNKKKL